MVLAFLQYLTYTLFYQRFVEDKIMNFIDLCSVSNVSLFILDQDHHGHYIHGRSPHGASDVNMKDMIKNLERETQLMSGTRGLVVNSTDQIFIMKINRRFRRQYDSFYRASDVSFSFYHFHSSSVFHVFSSFSLDLSSFTNTSTSN